MGKNAKEIKVSEVSKKKKNPNLKQEQRDSMPFESQYGFLLGPPPSGYHYRIPSDTLYNPTGYAINAIGSNGQEQFLKPFDTSNTEFPGADYVDEYEQLRRGGTPKSLKKYTSQNIKTSINNLMRRNETLFGPSGKKFYRPMQDGGWLDEYQTGGQNYGDDYSKSRANMNMLELSQNTPAPKKAFKFDPKALPHAPANMQEAQQIVDAQEKYQAEVNTAKSAAEKLAYSRMTKAQKEKYDTAKAKEEYVNNPGFMDYVSQVGYMPLLAMSNPFNMGEKLKELREIKVNDNLSPWQKFDQMGNVSTEATGNALINAATEGLTEGLLPGAIDKLSKLGKAKSTAKIIPNGTPAPNKKYFPISAEEKKDLSGFLERRQFLKDLQQKKLVGENLNLNEAAKFERNTNHVTQKALDHDMTAYRAVTGKVPPGGKGYNDVGDAYDMSSVAYGNDISEFDNMIKAGVNMDDPMSIAKYQVSHVPMQNYAYRSGLPQMRKADGIYAADAPARGYGDYLFKIKPKEVVDYSQGNYRNWLDQYMKHPTLSKEWESVVNQRNAPSVRALKSSIPKTYVGKKGDQIMDIDQTFPFMDTKKLSDKQKQELSNYIKGQKEAYKKGWIDDYHTARPKQLEEKPSKQQGGQTGWLSEFE